MSLTKILYSICCAGFYWYFPVQEEVEPLQQVTKRGTTQDMEDALATKTQTVEELSRELEEIRVAFGSEGIQQVYK